MSSPERDITPHTPSTPAAHSHIAQAFEGLLSVLGQEPHDCEVVEAATSIAPAGARWRAILPVPLPTNAPCMWGEPPEHALAVDHRARREDAEAHAGVIRRSLTRLGARADCELAECTDRCLEDTLLGVARQAGLVVAGVPPGVGGDMPVAARWFARLLIESGRPSLVVPRHAVLSGPPRRALVAWNDTPGSARALHEALRWLPEDCTFRLVLVVDADDTRTACDSAAAANALVSHVQRHRRTAGFDVVNANGRRAEDVLLEEARSTAADMIVMGAYGHSRVREFLLGGVTRGLLHRARVPLFMAH